MIKFLKRKFYVKPPQKEAVNRRNLYEELVYNPSKFSFVKALDVTNKLCDKKYIEVKSNINFASKYTDISVIEGLKDGLAEVHVNMANIAGIDGTLPDCYTEQYITYNREHKQAVIDFFDIFNERMLMLRYAYMKRLNTETLSKPVEKSVIGNVIFALSGVDFGTKCEKNAVLPEQFKISAQNLFWRATRSSAGLTAILESFFKVPVEIQQFEGGFIQLTPGEQTAIGAKGSYNRLGHDAYLGNKVWDATKGITILVGALDFEQYIKFLPKQSRRDQEYSPLQKMKEIIRLYVPYGIDVNLHFFLDKCLVRETVLNGINRLNKDTFLFGLHSSKDAFFNERI